MENALKSAHGTVRPYTRHSVTCPHRDDPDYNSCRCPKWLYTFSEQGKQRRSLSTPSWAEAQRIASDTLRAMDPEIAAARAVNEKHLAERMTVEDACGLWIDRTKRQFGEGGVLPQYRSLVKKLQAWTHSHGIVFVQDITPLQLEKWYSSRDWLRHADTTRSQRWGVLRSIFSYLRERGIIQVSPIAAIKPIRAGRDQVQGPYSDEQVSKLLAAIDQTVTASISTEERPVHAQRLRAFIHLLLHSGCDVVDGVLFEQSKVDHLQVKRKKIAIFRYKRQKTGVLAVVPVEKWLEEELRSVPRLKENPEGMPFRSGNDVRSDVHSWSRRIQRVLKVAGVDWVELPTRDKHGRPRRKKANAKQLRHTFAVRQLKSGQRPEEVSKMLGHVDTSMVRKHYAPWVPDLDEAHVTRVVSGWAAR